MRSSLLRQVYWYVCGVPYRRLSRRCLGTSAKGSRYERLMPDHPLVECSQSAEGDLCHVTLMEQFITQEEEDSLMGEVEKSLRRSRYQYEHWDGAIEGYRETEKLVWSPVNSLVVERLKKATCKAIGTDRLSLLPSLHVLDLAADGYIRPHVDSVKFCGRVIAGLSLLSPCVMRLLHQEQPMQRIDLLLPPLSLYILRDTVRYRYTHEILHRDSLESLPFKGMEVLRDRRVSVICRSRVLIDESSL